MRSRRLAVLTASTLLAILFLVPSAALAAGPAATLAALAPGQVSFTGPTNIRTGDGPVSIAAGDFNGDQDPDLAVANEFSSFPSNVSVLLGGAGGGFGAATNFPTGDFTFPFSVAAGDFNADQDPGPGGRQHHHWQRLGAARRCRRRLRRPDRLPCR
jgi:hypothetical protein